jgi:hypothetical protein
MIILSSSTRRLEGASAAQLFPGGDAEIRVARMLIDTGTVSECSILIKRRILFDNRLCSFGELTN